MKQWGMVCVLLAAACGDDSDPPATDSGPGDDAGSVEGDGGEASVFVAELGYVDSEGEPLEGVHVAVDSDLGRVEGESDADGRLTLEIPYVEEGFSYIVALEGYTILAFPEQGTIEDFEAGLVDGVNVVTLADVVPATGDTFRLRVTASGVPEGGFWCSGFGSWTVQCPDDPDSSIDFNAPTVQLGTAYHDGVTAFAFDADGGIYDFVEAEFTIDGDNRSASVVFDGELPSEPRVREMEVLLPEDAETPFRTMDLPPRWTGWIAAVDAESQLARGVPADLQILDDRITMTMNLFEPEEGMLWAMAPYASFMGPIRTFRWFSEEPTEDALSFLDVARVESGDAWNGEITWTEPAADVERYVVTYLNNASRVVIQAVTRTPSVQLQELPSAYDREVSFPFAGAPGSVQVQAVRGTTPTEEDGVTNFAVDGEVSTSARHPITW